jgi:hypothetical protein
MTRATARSRKKPVIYPTLEDTIGNTPLIALQRIGTGLSAQAIRVTASDLAALPLPPDRAAWKEASDALREGDVYGCGRHMMRAYGLNHRADLYDWWEQRVNGSRGRSD